MSLERFTYSQLPIQACKFLDFFVRAGVRREMKGRLHQRMLRTGLDVRRQKNFSLNSLVVFILEFCFHGLALIP